MTMTFQQVKETLALCAFPGYTFRAENFGDYLHISASYMEADTVTGAPERQDTRDYVLYRYNIGESIVISTAFLCVKVSMEHRAREWFTYKGRDIYGPHHDADALWQITPGRPAQ